jgi:hypothetical protein
LAELARPASTIRAYLLQLNWYATEISDFPSAAAAPPENFAKDFCRNVINKITRLGLNDFDAGIVLWPVYTGVPGKFPSYQTQPI